MSAAAFQIHENPAATGFRRSGHGSPKASTSQFAPNNRSEAMGLSYPQRGTNVPIQQRVTGTNVPEAVTTDEVRNEFADLTSGMSREELAEAAGRSVHAAKKWHAGVQAPDSASMITAARRRPKVRAWLLAKIGGDDARINSPQVLSELHTFLVNVATGEGDEAHEARRLFREIFR